jgi:transcriptional regulator with XRE-family HTH domain
LDIHKRLEYIRVSNRLSQQQMSEKLNLSSQQVYNNLEKGKTKKMAPELVKKILETFNIDIFDDRFFDNKKYIPIDGGEEKIFELLVQIASIAHAQSPYIAEIYSKLFGKRSTKVLDEMNESAQEKAHKIVDGLK